MAIAPSTKKVGKWRDYTTQYNNMPSRGRLQRRLAQTLGKFIEPTPQLREAAKKKPWGIV
jgi:hypothetical protein